MVKSMINDVVTHYASGAYQYKTDDINENTRKYYTFGIATAGCTTVAMRENGVVTWQMNDLINSATAGGDTTVTSTENGTQASEIRYTAFGETRWVDGVTITDNK